MSLHVQSTSYISIKKNKLDAKYKRKQATCTNKIKNCVQIVRKNPATRRMMGRAHVRKKRGNLGKNCHKD
jgi:hypothetical protein